MNQNDENSAKQNGFNALHVSLIKEMERREINLKHGLELLKNIMLQRYLVEETRYEGHPQPNRIPNVCDTGEPCDNADTGTDEAFDLQMTSLRKNTAMSSICVAGQTPTTKTLPIVKSLSSMKQVEELKRDTTESLPMISKACRGLIEKFETFNENLEALVNIFQNENAAALSESDTSQVLFSSACGHLEMEKDNCKIGIARHQKCCDSSNEDFEKPQCPDIQALGLSLEDDSEEDDPSMKSFGYIDGELEDFSCSKNHCTTMKPLSYIDGELEDFSFSDKRCFKQSCDHYFDDLDELDSRNVMQDEITWMSRCPLEDDEESIGIKAFLVDGSEAETSESDLTPSDSLSSVLQTQSSSTGQAPVEPLAHLFLEELLEELFPEETQAKSRKSRKSRTTRVVKQSFEDCFRSSLNTDSTTSMIIVDCRQFFNADNKDRRESKIASMSGPASTSKERISLESLSRLVKSSRKMIAFKPSNSCDSKYAGNRKSPRNIATKKSEVNPINNLNASKRPLAPIYSKLSKHGNLRSRSCAGNFCANRSFAEKHGSEGDCAPKIARVTLDTCFKCSQEKPSETSPKKGASKSYQLSGVIPKKHVGCKNKQPKKTRDGVIGVTKHKGKKCTTKKKKKRLEKNTNCQCKCHVKKEIMTLYIM